MFRFFKNLFISKRQHTKPYEFKELYDAIGFYPIYSEDHYIRALTHSSYTKNTQEKNERLEFLGDAVINFSVAEVLYHTMIGKDEGTLTKARATIVNRKNLNKVATEFDFVKYLRHKLSDKQLEEAPDIMGNAFEALMGAYFLEYGMQQSALIVANILMKDFDADYFHKTISDPKSYLIEWMQGRKKIFSFVHHTAPNDNTGVFSVSLMIDDALVATGIGKNKKEAEQQASLNAIKSLELDV